MTSIFNDENLYMIHDPIHYSIYMQQTFSYVIVERGPSSKTIPEIIDTVTITVDYTSNEMSYELNHGFKQILNKIYLRFTVLTELEYDLMKRAQEDYESEMKTRESCNEDE